MEKDESDAIDSSIPAGLPDAGGGLTYPIAQMQISLD